MSTAPDTTTLADFASDTVSVEQAGKILGLGRSATYSAINRGDIPGVIRIGRRVLISRHALATMLGAPNSATTHEGRAANATPMETSTIAHMESDHVVPPAY